MLGDRNQTVKSMKFDKDKSRVFFRLLKQMGQRSLGKQIAHVTPEGAKF